MNCRIQFIKTRFRIVKRFRRLIQILAIILLLIVLILLIPYLGISNNNPDLQALWLFEFQPKITFKIQTIAIFLVICALFINILNTKKIPGEIDIINDSFIIKLRDKLITIKFDNIARITLSLVYFSKSNYNKYRVHFDIGSYKKEEYMIHFTDENIEGRQLKDFFLNNKRLKIIQK